MIPSRQVLANTDTVTTFVSLTDIIAQITGMVYFLS